MPTKQLNFLSKNSSKSVQSVDCQEPKSWKLYIDGASRNNPGPAGVGICLKKNDKVACEQGFFIGTKTNNQAEYTALLIGLLIAKEFMKSDEKIAVFSDSQLLVRQMIGQYRVKDAQLKKLQTIALQLLQDNPHSFCHVYREDNTRADELANQGVDKKTPIPKRFADMMKEYEIL